MTTREKVSFIVKFLSTISLARENKSERVFFRGESKDYGDSSFTPSLFRDIQLKENETSMYNDVLFSLPDLFDEDQTTFERLVRMQHYGLPTRLLDVTTNPLVALYFACVENKDEDGIVFISTISNRYIKLYDNPSVEFLSRVSLLGKIDQEVITRKHLKQLYDRFVFILRKLNMTKGIDSHPELWSNIDNLKEDYIFKYLTDGLHEYNTADELKLLILNSIIFVKAPKRNSRQISQSGEFIIFGDYAKTSNLGANININKFPIKACYKNEILEILNSLNINHSTLFPDFSNTCKQVQLSYRK